MDKGAEPDGFHAKNLINKENKEMAMFMHDLEEDPELRANVNMYKVSRSTAKVFHVFNSVFRFACGVG